MGRRKTVHEHLSHVQGPFLSHVIPIQPVIAQSEDNQLLTPSQPIKINKGGRPRCKTVHKTSADDVIPIKPKIARPADVQGRLSDDASQNSQSNAPLTNLESQESVIPSQNALPAVQRGLLPVSWDSSIFDPSVFMGGGIIIFKPKDMPPLQPSVAPVPEFVPLESLNVPRNVPEFACLESQNVPCNVQTVPEFVPLESLIVLSSMQTCFEGVRPESRENVGAAEVLKQEPEQIFSPPLLPYQENLECTFEVNPSPTGEEDTEEIFQRKMDSNTRQYDFRDVDRSLSDVLLVKEEMEDILESRPSCKYRYTHSDANSNASKSVQIKQETEEQVPVIELPHEVSNVHGSVQSKEETEEQEFLDEDHSNAASSVEIKQEIEEQVMSLSDVDQDFLSVQIKQEIEEQEIEYSDVGDENVASSTSNGGNFSRGEQEVSRGGFPMVRMKNAAVIIEGNNFKSFGQGSRANLAPCPPLRTLMDPSSVQVKQEIEAQGPVLVKWNSSEETLPKISSYWTVGAESSSIEEPSETNLELSPHQKIEGENARGNYRTEKDNIAKDTLIETDDISQRVVLHISKVVTCDILNSWSREIKEKGKVACDTENCGKTFDNESKMQQHWLYCQTHLVNSESCHRKEEIKHSIIEDIIEVETDSPDASENKQTTPSANCEDKQTMPSVNCEDKQTMPNVNCENNETTPSVNCENNETTPSVNCENNQTTPSVNRVRPTVAEIFQKASMEKLEEEIFQPTWKWGQPRFTYSRKPATANHQELSTPVLKSAEADYQDIIRTRLLKFRQSIQRDPRELGINVTFEKRQHNPCDLDMHVTFEESSPLAVENPLHTVFQSVEKSPTIVSRNARTKLFTNATFR